MQLNKAAAIVDQAGGDASRELNTIRSEGGEGAACQLAQAPLQGGQRGHQGARKTRVPVEVEMAKALGVCQGAEHIQGSPLRASRCCLSIHRPVAIGMQS